VKGLSQKDTERRWISTTATVRVWRFYKKEDAKHPFHAKVIYTIATHPVYGDQGAEATCDYLASYREQGLDLALDQLKTQRHAFEHWELPGKIRHPAGDPYRTWEQEVIVVYRPQDREKDKEENGEKTTCST